ncbi:DMT family transporter [Teredinibacter haidensis]|uniref:DMT family transporter n=1 Tax=Teredinibacter haidensis TaxID=2731755 RepID=UPI0009F81704|nr:DMT family transporter [Teredinibacter haidensis]
MPLWISFTLLAAIMQAVRTAGQKSLSGSVSAMATTFVRYWYGLPFVFCYLSLLLVLNPDWAKQISITTFTGNARFLFFATSASVAQIAATYALIKVFTQRNFAVGTSFAKTEAIQVALLGSLLFADYLNWLGWLAVISGVVGTVVISGKDVFKRGSRNTSLYGLASGALFAVTSLFLREASLSLGLPLVLSAVLTLAFMVCLQSVVCALYLNIWEKPQWQRMKSVKKSCWFVGATSALGSVGWFTAMSLQNAALVKILGQVEFFITLAITHFYFREKIARFEWWGMVLIVASVLLVLQYR